MNNKIVIKEACKQDFLDYLDTQCSEIYLFDNCLSFAGSDGPKIKDWGFKDYDKYLFTEPEAIDEYIREGCENSCNAPIKHPKKSFTEYLSEKYGL